MKFRCTNNFNFKYDHFVIANFQECQRGWVNALTWCCPWIFILSSQGSKLLLYTLQQRSISPREETGLNPWGSIFNGLSRLVVPLSFRPTQQSINVPGKVANLKFATLPGTFISIRFRTYIFNEFLFWIHRMTQRSHNSRGQGRTKGDITWHVH